MIHIHSLRDGLPLFKALGSETRIAILELLIDKGPMRMTRIAQELKITGGALTTHVRMLNEAGILLIQAKGGRHGIQKVCSVNNERILIEAPLKAKGHQVFDTDVEVGQFIDFDVSAPCGLATVDRLLRPYDDPASFSDPERLRAGVLWMDKGYVEYPVPSFIKAGQRLTKLEIALEVGAGSPLIKETQEDTEIAISLNGKDLGLLPLKPCQESMAGKANPAWWNKEYRQRGTHHVLSVDGQGTFLNEKPHGDITLSDLAIKGRRSMHLRLSTVPGKQGFTLYGQGFGGQPYGIRVRSFYENINSKKKNTRNSGEG